MLQVRLLQPSVPCGYWLSAHSPVTILFHEDSPAYRYNEEPRRIRPDRRDSPLQHRQYIFQHSLTFPPYTGIYKIVSPAL